MWLTCHYSQIERGRKQQSYTSQLYRRASQSNCLQLPAQRHIHTVYTYIVRTCRYTIARYVYAEKPQGQKQQLKRQLLLRWKDTKKPPFPSSGHRPTYAVRIRWRSIAGQTYVVLRCMLHTRACSHSIYTDNERLSSIAKSFTCELRHARSPRGIEGVESVAGVLLCYTIAKQAQGFLKIIPTQYMYVG